MASIVQRGSVATRSASGRAALPALTDDELLAQLIELNLARAKESP